MTTPSIDIVGARAIVLVDEGQPEAINVKLGKDAVLVIATRESMAEGDKSPVAGFIQAAMAEDDEASVA